MATDYINIDGERVGFQFNLHSNGERNLKQPPRLCPDCLCGGLLTWQRLDAAQGVATLSH